MPEGTGYGFLDDLLRRGLLNRLLEYSEMPLSLEELRKPFINYQPPMREWPYEPAVLPPSYPGRTDG